MERKENNLEKAAKVIALKKGGVARVPVRKGRRKGQVDKNSARELGRAFTSRFVADFRKNGIAVIEQVRKESPVEYLKIATRLLPKDVNLTVEHSFSDVLMEAHNMILDRKYQEALEQEKLIDDEDDGE